MTLIDYINESLDVENLKWKINTWFCNRTEEQNTFDELCKLYKNTKATKDSLEKWLQGTDKKIKSFIDFLNDSVLDNESKDYIYLLGKVIDTINADKSEEK